MFRPALQSFRGKFPEPISCRYSAIHEEIASCDKRAVTSFFELALDEPTPAGANVIDDLPSRGRFADSGGKSNGS